MNTPIVRELEPELRSHLQLTRIRICRRGDDRENFISAAPHYFQHRDSDQSEHEMMELYEAYASCTRGMKRSRGETTVTVPTASSSSSTDVFHASELV